MHSEPPFSSLVDLDWDQLNQLSEGNSEFELEILQMFAEDLPAYIKEIKNAVVSQDLITLKRVSHQIKGSSSNVGAKKIESLATNLETVGSENSWQFVTEIVAKLEDRLEVIQQLIEQKYLKG
jgi:HPt (histidine-containing phosphotransfer) domain-containing protein